MKVQAGDVVHVRAVVTRVNDGHGNVAFDTIYHNGEVAGWCLPDQIVHVEPRALQVGDRVRTPYGEDGEIRMIEGGQAWVKCYGGNVTWDLSQLERV